MNSTHADWKRIEELAEKATPRPWAAWSVPATGSNDWADKAAIAGLPLTSVDRATVFWKRDAYYIAATANAAPDMAARLRRGDLPRLAAIFANNAHKGQKRKYNGRPYIEHPMRVAFAVSLIQEAGPEVIAAAWLHDVIEDCPVLSSDIDREFGPDVTLLVCELTNPSKMHKHLRRAERKAMDREHIANASRWAKVLKLLDRIDNIRDMRGCDDDFWKVYAAETRLLVDAIHCDDPLIESLASELLALLTGEEGEGK